MNDADRPSAPARRTPRFAQAAVVAGVAVVFFASPAMTGCEKSPAKPGASADMEKRKKSLIESMDKYAEPDQERDPQPASSPAKAPDPSPTPAGSPDDAPAPASVPAPAPSDAPRP